MRATINLLGLDVSQAKTTEFLGSNEYNVVEVRWPLMST